MTRPYILFSAIEQDWTEIISIANVAQSMGWSVRSLAIGPSDDEEADIPPSVAGAAGVVVFWSSEATRSSKLIAVARHALASRKLLPVQLDHAPPPLAGGRALDLSNWNVAPNAAQRASFQTRLQAIAGPAEDAFLRSTAPAAGQRRWRAMLHGNSRRLGLAAAAAGAGLAIVAGVTWEAWRPGAPHPIAEAIAAATAPGGARSLEASPALPAEALIGYAWQATNKEDPLAVHAFLALAKSGPAADEAKALLRGMDELSWRKALDETDALAALRAIADYRYRYPSGAFLKEATKTERELRRAIADAQSALNELGYLTEAPTGEPSQLTAAALARFSADHSLSFNDGLSPEVLARLRAEMAPRRAP